MGNQNVISTKQEKELLKVIKAYVGNGAPAKAIAAECGINWGLFQHYMSGDSNKRILELSAKKLAAWIDGHDEYMPDSYARCTKCGKVKPLDEFHKDASKPTGHRSCCVDCRRRYERERAVKIRKESDMANNNTEVAITIEIVKKVKAEDNPSVPPAMLAPYFGISPRQLEAVRNGEWDSLLYKKEPPAPATDVKNAVEALRVEIAEMHSALNRLMMEMGCAEVGDAKR